MTTDKTPATLAVDVLAVMDEMYRALPPVRSDGPAFVMNWEMERRQQAYENARAAVAELIRESEKIEDSVHKIGMTCGTFSTALARTKGEIA
ncbi:hypothetical protein ORG27_14745 [Stenotrophomonas lactitubi]|uniref:hypothetical protein n=1 Tax=Stenotrophomonas lactitubi TaxID=2045214 RepID=UPI002249702D|nr:hypothetical protein [Stenotrophomonas lactitubi]MCX2894835.1 hypothetical protein [Stenotrophomonas lactitubi]